MSDLDWKTMMSEYPDVCDVLMRDDEEHGYLGAGMYVLKQQSEGTLESRYLAEAIMCLAAQEWLRGRLVFSRYCVGKQNAPLCNSMYFERTHPKEPLRRLFDEIRTHLKVMQR